MPSLTCKGPIEIFENGKTGRHHFRPTVSVRGLGGAVMMATAVFVVLVVLLKEMQLWQAEAGDAIKECSFS